MNGLERMDAPRRWPWVAGVSVVVLLVATLIWARLHHVAPSEPAPAAIPTCSGSEAHGVPEPGVADPVVANPVPPAMEAVQPARTNLVDQADRSDSSHPSNAQITAVAPKIAAEAETLLASGKKDKAREQYLAALDAQPDAALRASIEEALGALNVELIRLPWPMAEKHEVVVQEGDSIKAIARKSGTTVELIVRGNQLKRPDVIIPGQRLKVFSGKMEIKVSKARNDLVLTSNGRFFKRYRVGTGRYDKTPVGSFVICERIPEPPWWRDDGKTIPFGDKENILGTRWMAIKATGDTKEIKGYGIHGTWDNASIGKAESAGCIRLKNEDVEELFELVPIGTPVVIDE